MFAIAWRWAKRQNFYVLSAVVGTFGLIDAIAPGPRADHMIGAAIVATAAFIWLVQ